MRNPIRHMHFLLDFLITPYNKKSICVWRKRDTQGDKGAFKRAMGGNVNASAILKIPNSDSVISVDCEQRSLGVFLFFKKRK